jgi:c-di-GMP-binding flagellar brake protein YcgR
LSKWRNERQEERRNLHCTAVVRLRNGAGTNGRTIDISSRGISIVLPEQLAAGAECLIAFDTVVNGNRFSIAVQARSVYAILSGSQFRTGFTFSNVDPVTEKSLAELHNQLFV